MSGRAGAINVPVVPLTVTSYDDGARIGERTLFIRAGEGLTWGIVLSPIGSSAARMRLAT